MTYCVGIKLSSGLMFLSDTRTNAGVDNISRFRKQFTWSVPGERALVLMTAGNLATTQAVVSLLEERTKAPSERRPSILELPTMFQIARHVGETLKDVIQSNAMTGQWADSAFNSTLILGGQVKGMEPRMFMIYPEGNFIEASDDTPFFQIGETKYGLPILVRAYDPNMAVEDAAKLLLVSFDSTIKANLSVGLPLDMQVIVRDSLRLGPNKRIEAEDPYYKSISNGWSDALKKAFDSLPPFTF